ncbi:dihydrolipoamide acetyltransferase family protein [Lutimaribacter saemankumensis]|uniref:Dihydrolipoamide acetyltransferase component of pyruvate dehydrogenase complex n=1 Tax=Lutimaribacter saemankumensis TaxID=490829 RepID=A0A1G8T3F4_9RHOB|nr:dihydrolipoamide acetyltransferase family protein [Lutimaribacter saemankumensis]SDJ36098.1 pyruvate dehydrogenase E2 component (dihydrolipoamide acetyltransferase) [Lutimaribacter saemankumensis]
MAVFTMPSLGADMEAGTLSEWLVAPGDEVRRGDSIAVVETQKGAIEIECFEEGRVQELLAVPGAELPVGAPLALILAPGESEHPTTQAQEGGESRLPTAAARQTATSAPPPKPDSPTRREAFLRVSPAARMRAKEQGIDLSTIEGSGPDGAIVLADIGKRARPEPSTRSEKHSTQLDEMRKVIAAAMTRSKQTIPHFYLSQTIDVQPAIDWLEARNRDATPGERLLLGALVVRAAALAAVKVPSLNGHFVDGAFRPSAEVNAGIVIALRGGGLVAPALNDAVGLSLDETMTGMRDLVSRARAGRLKSSEMAGGTITISSLGETGAETMTGVIFPPQVALVGVGAPQLRPWIVAGKIVPRMLINVTISADHRVSDGRQAAKYIAEFETRIERPETL